MAKYLFLDTNVFLHYKPVEQLKHKIDYEHYIDKQLRPIADSILVFYDKNFDDLIIGSEQKSLFEY